MIFTKQISEFKAGVFQSKLMILGVVLILLLLMNSCENKPRYFTEDYKFEVTRIEVAPHQSICEYWVTCFDGSGIGNVTFRVNDSIGKWKIEDHLQLIEIKK